MRAATVWILPALLAIAVAGCDFERLAATQAADLYVRAAPALEKHWDYAFAGDALPSNILQLEGLLRVVPDHQGVTLQLIKAYSAYAYGWVEEEMETARDEGDLAETDRHRGRARLFYVRARDLGLHLLRLHERSLDAALNGGAVTLKRWLAEHFRKPADAPAVFWAGYTWGAAINVSRDKPAMVADLPIALALVQHSVSLDAEYYHASGLAFLGFAAADFPPALGGDPEKGRQLFERALKITARSARLIQVQYARSYAVTTQNRELFKALLEETVTAPDDNPSARLANQIARRKAARSLSQISSLF